MNAYSPAKWRRFFEGRGLESALIDEYIQYIRGLSPKNIAIIFEFEHLAYLLGLEESVLAKMINAPEAFYRCFTIPKRRGGKRKIVSPYPSLLGVQRWIAHNILSKFDVHPSAHGYVPGRSILTNANNHLGAKSLLKMDLSNFFPSVEINWVIRLFKSSGYSDKVAFYLAALCCFERGLGQGAATSPSLTNILLLRFDCRLTALAKSFDLKYSRYADDLAFSGNYIPLKFVNIVTAIIEDYGLRVNSDKTQLCTGSKKIVTGISVSGSSPKLPRETKRELRKQIHFIRKFGLVSHMSKMKISDPFFVERLIGYFDFWLFVEPSSSFALAAKHELTAIRVDG